MGSKIEEPSFNSYSSKSPKLAGIAARVIRELEHVSQSDSLETPSLLSNNDNNNNTNGLNSDQNDKEQEQEEEFEFSFVSVEPNVTADEIFHNGQIKPLYYPLFNTALLEEPPRKRTPLGKLLKEETRWSCSSSEAEEEELERVPTESYCLWNPNERNRRLTSSSMGKMGKKSKSTGSVSKRWKLKNILLHRSNSVDVDNNGKISSNNNNSNTLVVLITSDHKDRQGGEKERPTVARDIGDAKRRSYLPYRQGLVGLFSNVNGLSKKLHPF